MIGISWWLVDVVSRLLEPDEREIVRGDFAESGETGGRALRDLLGLVVRRQAALWKDWRPWLALAGLVIPVGLLLSEISFLLSHLLLLHLRTHWRYGVPYANGLTAPEQTVLFIVQALALFAWSWTGGFVLGSLARRTIWVIGALGFLIWVSPLLLMLAVAIRVVYTSPRHLEDLPLGLFMLILQSTLHTVMFLLPAISGMRQGRGKLALGLPQASVLAAAIIALTVLATWTAGWPQAAVIRWSGGVWDASTGWQGRLLPFAVASWPAGYLLAVAIHQEKST